MIKKLQKLKGVPSESTLPYRTFSPEGRGSHREGTVVEFTMTDGAKWIGNFVSDAEGLSQPLSPVFLDQGVALVFHDRWCFVVKNEASEPERFDGFSPWFFAKPVPGQNLYVIASTHGLIQILGDAGQNRGTQYFDCAESLVISELNSERVKGSYYEFNLRKNLSFELKLSEVIPP